MGFELVGWKWTAETFAKWVPTQRIGWAKGVTLHHTATPSLEMRPGGFSAQHILNLRDYYRDERRWSAGPHLFVDDFHIHGMSSIERRGVHSPEYNRDHIGIEVLGDYDEKDDPESERGRRCWRLAASAVVALGFGTAQVKFHRDDPSTSKTCPGQSVSKKFFFGLMREAEKGAVGSEVLELIGAMEEQLVRLRELILQG